MSFLTSTTTLRTATALPQTITRAAALALLHDHPAFQSLQPLLTANTIIPAPTHPSYKWLIAEASTHAQPIEYREVTVAVPMGPWRSSVVTTTAWVDTEDGVVMAYQAPMGLSGSDRWRVVRGEGKGEGDGWVLDEESVMMGFWPMMGMVAGTKKGSHLEVGKAFVERLEGQGRQS